MIKTLYLLVFIFFKSLSVLNAQQLLKLHEAISIALENNYAIQIVKNEYEIAKLNNTIGNAGMLPSVDANLVQDNQTLNTKQKFLNGAENIRNNAINNSINSNIELNWTIFNGRKMYITRKKLAEIEMIGKLQLKQQVEDIVAKTIKTYYEIVVQQNKIEFLQHLNNLNKERMLIVEEKYKNGKTSKTEWLKTVVDFNTDESLLLKEKNNLQVLKFKLNQILAREIEIPFDVINEFEISKLNIEEIEKGFEQNHTGLQILKHNRQLSMFNTNELKAQRWPLFQLRTGYLYNTLNSEAGFLQNASTNGFHYGAGVSFNLFNGFNLNKKINISQLQLLNADIALKDSLQQLKTALKQLSFNYTTGLLLIEKEKANVSIASENFNISKELFLQGKITALELRTSQNELLQTQNRLLLAMFETKIFETDLMRLTGRL